MQISGFSYKQEYLAPGSQPPTSRLMFPQRHHSPQRTSLFRPPPPPPSHSLAPVLPWGHLNLPSMGSASSAHPVSTNISWLQWRSPTLPVIILRLHGKRDLTSSPWLLQGPGHGRCIPIFLMTSETEATVERVLHEPGGLALSSALPQRDI